MDRDRIIDEIEAGICREAAACGLTADAEVYAQCGRDHARPILFAGSLDSRVAFLGRDLGREEVKLGEPLIGGAGRRIRTSLYRCLLDREPESGNRYMHEATSQALLTNTVPFKPIGNKAYPAAIRERFRPYIERLLTCCWTGSTVITLGNEAFHWFAPYAEPGVLDELWQRPDRYESSIACIITSDRTARNVLVAPLPHPSPQNVSWCAAFPGLLEKRLKAVFR